MEEIRNYEEVTEQAMEMAQEANPSGKGVIGFVAGAVVLVGGAAVLYARKTKDKREAKQVEKLRKKGYVIYEPVVEEPVSEEDCEDLEEGK